ncbi:EcsC family protein [Psychrobacter raelei]|uniref:EcsC family protein n=1 Tax=Psychrobacter raelei TaxID=2565531 RepID=A0AAT9PEG5_9GAMM
MAKQSKSSKKSKAVVTGLDVLGHVARNNLERFGSMLDSLSAKSGKASQFKAVDLSDYKTSTASNLLSQQTIKTSEQLLGKRFATYGKYAKKVVPNSIYQKASDSVFSQVAKLAATWSEIDLPREQRFEGIQTLSDQERNALARDIANQNRALATIGGVTGLAGLPGMLADTLWLLLVSLRTVYQLATVYDKPLTGKQGIKMAYAVIGSADLSKMQEKQTILAALGVAKGLISNADNTGLRSELSKGLGIAGSNIEFYAKQVDKLAEQFNFDLDSINISWMGKFLPLVAVGTTVHYNSHLIDQVIGVAKATFGPEPIVAKQALTDATHEEDQSDNASEKAADKKQPAKNDSEAKTQSADEAADKNADNNADNKQTKADKKTEVSDDVADQFGEEPTDPTKGAETQESYDFHTQEGQPAKKDAESTTANDAKNDAKKDQAK